MSKTEKKNVITKDMLIRQVASDTYTSQATVRSIYEGLEQRIFENLMKASENNPKITIKLFEGVNFESKYVPSKKKKNNLTGEVIQTISKIKPKVVFTRNYMEKLSEIIRF